MDQLGPKEFRIAGHSFVREDFELTNDRGLKLVCSWFRPVVDEARPVVIYLHGNSGCRCDADDPLHTVLPYGCSVLSFDFSGSGQSGGDYVSLGVHEQKDVECVLRHLRSEQNSLRVSYVALWGRSMGAATAILYARSDPGVAAMVLDSPFSDLPALCEEVAASSQLKVPKTVLKVGMALMKKGIQKRAHFDIADCSPIKCVDECFVPALFVHGERDDFIAPRHSELLFEKYAGEKNRILVKGGHNSVRPQFMRDSASIFLAQCMNMVLLEPGATSVPIPVGLNTVGLNLEEMDEDAFRHFGEGDIVLGGGGGVDINNDGDEEDEIAKAIALSLLDVQQEEK